MGQRDPRQAHPLTEHAMGWMNNLPVMTRSILLNVYRQQAEGGDPIAVALLETWDHVLRGEAVPEVDFYALLWSISTSMYNNKERMDEEIKKQTEKTK